MGFQEYFKELKIFLKNSLVFTPTKYQKKNTSNLYDRGRFLQRNTFFKHLYSNKFYVPLRETSQRI